MSSEKMEFTDTLIGLLKERGYGSRDRLLRKLMEEMGEYCEAIEFDLGATRKKEKFGDKNPRDMLHEEISDVVMVALALASFEGLTVSNVLENINKKLYAIEKKYGKYFQDKE